MKNIISLFRTDPMTKWKTAKEKVWKDAEDYYEQLLKKTKENLSHMVYLCSPLKPTKQKLIQVHIAEAILAASKILGAEYKGKKIAVWVPHLHLFSIYNEIVYPDVREKAIKFNNHLIQQYFHSLVVIGDRISRGMSAEIKLARKNGVKVIKMRNFKRHLRNLPDSEKAKGIYQKMISLHNRIHGSEVLIKQ